MLRCLHTLEQHVIGVDLHVPANLVFKHGIHKPLVCFSFVLQPEWQDLAVVQPKVCEKEVSISL
jgi:hypothetical protein